MTTPGWIQNINEKVSLSQNKQTQKPQCRYGLALVLLGNLCMHWLCEVCNTTSWIVELALPQLHWFSWALFPYTGSARFTHTLELAFPQWPFFCKNAPHFPFLLQRLSDFPSIPTPLPPPPLEIIEDGDTFFGHP